MKTIQTILLVTALTMSAAVAQHDGRGRGSSEPGKAFRADVMEKLGLTDEQAAALKEVRNEAELRMIDLRANVQKARLAARNQMETDSIDRDALIRAVEAESAAELAVKKARIDQLLKVREILGPEKAEQLREQMQNQRGQKGKEWKRGRDDRGEGCGPHCMGPGCRRCAAKAGRGDRDGRGNP